MERKLFSKDFTLVVLGQIVSLFGNATVRFALPLYLLNRTGSSALYGAVTACAFLPAILLSPIGGIVADRVNKRNIMVALDFFTAAVITAFSLLMGGGNLVLLMAVTLMLLYGIAGAYQPAVQASIPALINPDRFMEANSVIQTISSFASLLGPVLGGVLYSACGLKPVLWVCSACFFLSAVMELFIKMPSVRQDSVRGIWKTVKGDFAESLRFIRRDQPLIWKILLVLCGINLFLSAMIIVGLPYMVTEVLKLEEGLANRLYGFAQGALAAGGLSGGIGAGLFAGKLNLKVSGVLLIVSASCAFPMGIAGILSSSAMVIYMVMAVCCFLIMVFSTVFSVQVMSFVQVQTPQNLVGKVIALMLTVAMCAQPLGNDLYGALFEICPGREFAVILSAGVVSLGIALSARRLFRELPGEKRKEMQSPS